MVNKLVYTGYNEAYANERKRELERYGHKCKKEKKGSRILIYRV
jgi:hypothetical protein